MIKNPKAGDITKTTLSKEALAHPKKNCGFGDELETPERYTTRIEHELQVHQIELELQNKELIAARDLAENSAENYATLFDFAPVGYIILNSTGHITQSNLAAASLLGAPREKVKGNRLSAYLTDDSLADFNHYLANTFSGAGLKQAVCEVELSVNHKITSVQLKVSLNDDGLECLTVLTDITAHKKTQVSLKLAANVLNHAHEGIMITEINGTIIEVNDAFTKITGFSHQDAVGENPRILKSGRQSADYYRGMWKALQEQGYWCAEVWNRRKNGDIYPEIQSISTVYNAAGKPTHYVSMFTDITESKAHQQRLEHTAHFDLLTDLPNRAYLAEQLAKALRQNQRHGKMLAVAYLDLDGFKKINDTYGHNTGDQFLITIAQRLTKALRAGDLLARIGGDEFIAVLGDLDIQSDCEPVLKRMLAAAAKEVIFHGELLKVSTSIGVTFYPTDGSDPDLLLRQADQAMYLAKDAGKSCYYFFDTESAELTRTLGESLEQIRHAFEHKEFVLYYQPKVNMKTGAVVGVEALIRWHHPEKGVLAPLEFLPIIEGHTISVKMGEWVIDTALKQIRDWQLQGLDITVSVNIGASQLLSENFEAHLSKALAAYPEISPKRLELEILETSALEDMMLVSKLMDTCRGMGVSFALDDFGTGYSSLTYLKRLPVAQLKIDQTFVRDMLIDPSDLAIVKAVIGLAEIFDLDVIAEGVETKAHGEKLLSLNCTIAQGYGVARPMPADEFPGWVESWEVNPTWTA